MTRLAIASAVAGMLATGPPSLAATARPAEPGKDIMGLPNDHSSTAINGGLGAGDRNPLADRAGHPGDGTPSVTAPDGVIAPSPPTPPAWSAS